MTNKQLVTLISCLAACVYATGLMLSFGFAPGQLSEGAGRTAVALRGVKNFGPELRWSGPRRQTAAIRGGRQGDLFGTPFGPPFSTQNCQNHTNLPEFRRIRPRIAACYGKRVRGMESGRQRRWLDVARLLAENRVVPKMKGDGSASLVGGGKGHRAGGQTPGRGLKRIFACGISCVWGGTKTFLKGRGFK